MTLTVNFARLRKNGGFFVINCMIHPHTYIHPNARLANNVKVDPFTVIHQDVEIGEGTWIGSNVTIMEGARIGKNCSVFPGAVIAAIPQDLKFQGEYSQVFIGDNTTIREFVTVNRGTRQKEKTVIGKNCMLMAYCHLAQHPDSGTCHHWRLGDTWRHVRHSPVCKYRPALHAQWRIISR